MMSIENIRKETEWLVKGIFKNHITPETSGWSMMYGGTYHIHQKAYAFDGTRIQLVGTNPGDLLSLKEVHDIYIGIEGCRWCDVHFDGNFVFIDSFWRDDIVMFYKDFEGWWGSIDNFIVDDKSSIFYRGDYHVAGDHIPGLNGPKKISEYQIEYLK